MTDPHETDYYEQTYTQLYALNEKVRRACLHALPALAMIDTIDPAIESALDVGCGNGLLVWSLRERGIEALGLDVTTPERPRCDPAWFTKGNMLDLPWPDSEFDVVSCCDTIEHLKPDHLDRGYRELVRVAKRWVLMSYGIGRPPKFVVRPPGVERLHETLLPFEGWLRKTEEFGLRLARARVLNTTLNMTLWEVRK